MEQSAFLDVPAKGIDIPFPVVPEDAEEMLSHEEEFDYRRPTRSLLEVTIHSPTRPCIYERRCPHDRDPTECETTQGVLTARKCPSSFGPAVVRRSAATRWLSEGIPREVVSEHMNIPEDELDQHYDERSPTKRLEQRREYFDQA